MSTKCTLHLPKYLPGPCICPPHASGFIRSQPITPPHPHTKAVSGNTTPSFPPPLNNHIAGIASPWTTSMFQCTNPYSTKCNWTEPCSSTLTRLPIHSKLRYSLPIRKIENQAPPCEIQTAMCAPNFQWAATRSGHRVIKTVLRV